LLRIFVATYGNDLPTAVAYLTGGFEACKNGDAPG
jgi:hypothetical protein